MLITTFMVVLALIADYFLGEPRRYHPLAGFGRYANWVESKLNLSQSQNDKARLLRGGLALSIVCLPWLLIVYFLVEVSWLTLPLSIVVLYFCIAPRSLHEHASEISGALREDNLSLARERVGRIVSRDTREMSEQDVARAATESVLENGSDAVFGALFWFIVAGAPGALLYRMVNTLDAMWGYRNDRFNFFGRAAARLDDVLNYVPARLTALTYAVLGSFRNAIYCWRTQAPEWDSPNAGPVMAAGAGSLQVRLGGGAVYEGEYCPRPVLGTDDIPTANDIDRALRLVRHGILLWIACLIAMEFLYA